MINLMGYHLSNEFKSMSKEEQKRWYKKHNYFN